MTPLLPPHSAHPGLLALRLGCACALLIATAAMAASPEAPRKLEERVRMRDGVHLATDVWLPPGDAPFPVVFLRFPYNKDLGVGLGKDGTARGFAVVAQDTRGRFKSEGENLPFHLDGPDGEDSVAWIAKQPWSNGRIGTWGGSAGAITQFQLAVHGTGAVDAQYLVVGAPNLYDVVYTGGIFRKSLIEDWIRGTKFQSNALARWVAHPRYDAFWQAQDATRHYRDVHAAAVHVGGYWDIFAQPTIDAFLGYQQRGGRGARGRQKLLMGPWAHAVMQEKVGELLFRDGKKPPGMAHDHWAWFEHWLKDADNGLAKTPAVTYYVIGDATDPAAPGNVWRQAAAWPPVPTQERRLYLHADGVAAFQRPPDAAVRTYAHDPAHPVPTRGGIQLTIPAGPMDQREIEAREDVLVFTTTPLEAPMEMTGKVQARLWVASDGPDTDFFVRVCDVYPDGRSFNLCEGMLRTRFRDGLTRERLMTPGTVYPLDIDCWSTSVIFNRGHRIRVHVTSSSSPGWDVNPNTGDGFRANDRQRVARNTVYLGGTRASHILLPIAQVTP